MDMRWSGYGPRLPYANGTGVRFGAAELLYSGWRVASLNRRANSTDTRQMLKILLSLIFIIGSVDAGAQASRPPNIIIILADDLGWGDVGFNGRREWRTPNLDRLARDGVRFERWYTAAVVCAPSRAALMTGKYTIHNGVSSNGADLPRSEVCLPAALKPLGYRTALFGKWHHGAARPGETDYIHPLDRGFDEFFGFTNATHAWEKYPKELWDGRVKTPATGYADTLFADRAIDFIRRHREQPFFVYLAMTSTHFHVEAPEEDVERFRGRFPEKDVAKPFNATYAAMVTRLDREVGRVLHALDRNRLSRNTIVVFTSDHGATFETGNAGASAFHDSNHPFRGQKRTLWEGGIRVPGIVRWPGVTKAGWTCPAPVHMTDLFPTLLSAAGGRLDPAWKVDGHNLLDLWRGLHPEEEWTRFWEWRVEGSQQLAAMRGDYKLVVTGTNPLELFNVVADPGERRNRAAEFPDLVKRLQEELTAWLATETEESKQGRGQPRRP